MEWIWVVFIVFAIISNLAEKQGKQKKNNPRPPFAQSRPGSRPVSPRTDPLPEWVRNLDFFGSEQEGAPQGRKNLGQQEERSVRRERDFAEQKDIFSRPGPASDRSVTDRSVSDLAELKKKEEKLAKDLVLEEGIDPELEDAMFLAVEEGIERQDEDPEELLSEGVWAGDDGAFQAALLLAQALPRPDLKTFPWQRKI